jgi:hypothetical protein
MTKLSLDTDNNNYEEPICDEVFTAVTTDSNHQDLYDSGASVHITPYKECLANISNCPGGHIIRACNGQQFYANAIGDMVIKMPSYAGGKTIRHKQVLWAPVMAHTVISLGCLDDARWTWTGGKGKLPIHNGDKDLVAKIPKSDGRYKITTDFVASVNESATPYSLYDLHCLLGHVSYSYIHEMIHQKQLVGVKIKQGENKEIPCILCLHGKTTRSPIAHQHTSPLAEKYGDKHATALGAYFIIFIDFQYQRNLRTQYTTQNIF